MEINKLLKGISLGKNYKESKIEIREFDKLFSMAKAHGLEDYAVNYYLECCKDDEQKDYLEVLKNEQVKKALISECKLKELQRIVEALTKAEINFAVIKGFGTLFFMKADNLNTKAYSDYDILVQENQIEKAKEIFKEIGYVQKESEEKDFIRKQLVWHVSPLIKEPFFVVELHHRFTQIYDKHNFDVCNALKNKILVQVRGITFPTLGLEDSLYLLALHLYQHEYKDITFQLGRHAEIVNIILAHQNEIDWEQFIQKIIINNACFPVTYTFYHINLVYKEVLGRSCIPDYVVEKIMPEDFFEKKDMLWHRHMYEEQPFGSWDFETFHWKLKYGKEWEKGYEARLFGDMKYVTLRYYYLFFRHYADGKWEEECRKAGIEYKTELFF